MTMPGSGDTYNRYEGSVKRRKLSASIHSTENTSCTYNDTVCHQADGHYYQRDDGTGEAAIDVCTDSGITDGFDYASSPSTAPSLSGQFKNGSPTIDKGGSQETSARPERCFGMVSFWRSI